MNSSTTKKPKSKLACDVAKALKRAAKRARETARRYGTPIHVEVEGKIVRLKP